MSNAPTNIEAVITAARVLLNEAERQYQEWCVCPEKIAKFVGDELLGPIGLGATLNVPDYTYTIHSLTERNETHDQNSAHVTAISKLGEK